MRAPSREAAPGVGIMIFLLSSQANRAAPAGAIREKHVTYDLQRQMEGATKVSTSEFGDAIVDNMSAD